MASNRSQPLRLGLSPVQALTRFPGLAPSELPTAPAPPPTAERWAVPLGAFRLLIDPALSCELSQGDRIWPIPNTPAWIRGVINRRGDLVPVFDLRALFGPRYQWPSQGATLLFIVGTGDDAGAIITDGLPYRLRLDDGQPSQPPADLPEPLARRLHATYQCQDTHWLACDLPGLLHDLGRRADATSGGENA